MEKPKQKSQKVTQILESRSLSYKDVDDSYALIDVVVSTGAGVYRREVDSVGRVVEFERALEISEDAIRMNRLLQGAPVLDNHNDGANGDSVNRILGSVETAWIEGSGADAKLMATLKISKITQEDKEVAQKIKSGIITGVSVGAEIHSQRNVTSDNDDIMKVVADDWEPYEVSLVMVPADGQSIIRNKGGSSMSTETKLSLSEAQMKELASLMRVMNEGDEEKEAEEEEQMIEDEEKMLEDELSSDDKEDEEDKEEKMLEDELSADQKSSTDVDLKQLAAEIARHLRKQSVSSETIQRRKTMRASHHAQHEARNKQIIHDHISDVLATRITRGLHKTENKNNIPHEYSNPSLMAIARDIMHRSGKYSNVHMMKKVDVYKEIMSPDNRIQRSAGGPVHVSSDFSDLLSDSVNKSVISSYESMRGKQTFGDFVSRVTVDDFKEQERVQAGESGDLELTPPGADSSLFTMTDRVEKYKAYTYSKMFQLTRQGFINDDTGELSAILASGASAADLESNLVYEQVTKGQVDGSLWYSTARGNSTAGNNTSLAGSGRNAYNGIKAIYEGLATRTGLDVDTPLHFTFKYLLVPVALVFEAQQTKGVAYPATPETPNPFAPMYKIISEPRLDRVSKNAYYGIASECAGSHTWIELATLSGQPITKYEETFSSDVLRWKLTHDAAAKMIDYRVAHYVKGEA